MKKILLLLLKIAVIGGAFWFLVSRGQLKWENIAKTFSYPQYLLPAIFLMFLPMLISFYRYHILLKSLSINIYRFADVMRIGFIGCFFNTFMPGAMGGDLVKVGYIMRDSQQHSKAIASVMIDRVQGLFGLLLIGGLAMLLAWQNVQATPSLHKLAVAIFALIGVSVCGMGAGIIALLRGRKVAFFAFGGLTIIAIIGGFCLLLGADFVFRFVQSPNEELTLSLAKILLRGRLLVALIGCWLAALGGILLAPSCLPERRLSRLIGEKLPLGKSLMNLINAMLLFHNNLAVLFYTLFLSLCTHASNLFAVYCISQAADLPYPPDVLTIFFAAPLAFVANSLPMPGGGLGVGEAAFAEILSLCRNANGQAIIGGAAIFLTVRFWTVILSFIFGFPYYLRGKKTIDAMVEQEKP